MPFDLWTWRSRISRPKDCRRRRQGWSLRLRQLEPREMPSVLVWSDEFDGPPGSAPDPAKWGYDLGGGGWGNAELEVYTNSTQNASITADPGATDGKALAIRALKTGTNSYTSARLKTKNIQSWTYGRFEARLRLPYGQGMWPAFWMLGSNIDSVGWPTCGEIDVMENIGREPSTVHGTLHGPGYSGGNGIGAGYTLPGGQKFSDAFHTFAVDWGPNTIRWYVDDQLYQTRTPADLPAGKAWVFDHNFFMILNLAVGGQWPGNPDSTTVFPQTYLVDYVRVYQDAPDPRNVKVNFQTSNSQGFPGYVADTGLAFADRGNGYRYGWNVDNTANARNRNSANAPDERYDTLNHLQKAGGANRWEIALPKGTYNLHVVAGDPDFVDSINNLNLEGTVVTDPDGNDNFDEYNAVVTVTDGRLTIIPAAGAINAKLDFIDISPKPTTPPTLTVRTLDGGATVTASSVKIDVMFTEPVVGVDATVQSGRSQGIAGYVADTGMALADWGNGYSYGWNLDPRLGVPGEFQAARSPRPRHAPHWLGGRRARPDTTRVPDQRIAAVEEVRGRARDGVRESVLDADDLVVSGRQHWAGIRPVWNQ
ncbi:MAG TPA: glycoside hydrolase family 16 protein [Gemmataceae bacterium]|nr:glycoside hydrolase family 16 protein [Gemmataceae bacterium]